MKKTIQLLFVLVCVNSFAQPKNAQKLIDSLLTALPKMKQDTVLVNAYNTLSYSFAFIDSNKAIMYGNKAMAMARKL